MGIAESRILRFYGVVSYTFPRFLQNPTRIQGDLLNSGDLFLLKEEYPNLKDSVSVKMLDFMVEAQFGIDFNRLENAAVALDRGQHINIPVEVNGTTKSYIFGTGCSFGNFVSEKYAEEVGLKIAADSAGQ